jgi:1-acyl-sn-glycerol-3-phosphate acyltransferase
MFIKLLCYLSYLLVRAMGWRITGERPREPKVMILGAPHTSNLDYFLTLALMHHFQLPLRYLIKDSVFRTPLGPLIRMLGGIPVDRSKANNLVEGIVNTIKAQEVMAIGVLPEGTRKYVPYWRSGFYYIASGAEIPIYPVSVDGPNKHLHMGPALVTSGDIEADMELLANFFGDIKGVIPKNSAPVRLRPAQPTPTLEQPVESA